MDQVGLRLLAEVARGGWTVYSVAALGAEGLRRGDVAGARAAAGTAGRGMAGTVHASSGLQAHGVKASSRGGVASMRPRPYIGMIVSSDSCTLQMGQRDVASHAFIHR